MAATIYDFLPIDANNVSFAGISQAENVMKPSDVNNDFRAKDGAFSRWLLDLGGAVTVSGTNTYAATLNQGFTAYGTAAGNIINGTVIAIKPVNSNTGASTFNPNAIGAKAIRLQGDTALSGGEMVANGIYLLRYDTAYNSAAGAWVLINSGYLPLSGGTLTGDLNIIKASPDLLLSKAASGQNVTIEGRTAAVARWKTFLGDSTTESGGNAGSNFSISRYDDSGVFISSPISITRSSGLITLGDGQLQFPAVQNPSSNVNTLDDYEEGTWTPTVTIGGASTGITYNFVNGQYTKIGNTVFFEIDILLTSKGALTGSVGITSLPFVSNSNNTSVGSCWTASMASLVDGAMWFLANSTSSISLYTGSATGNVVMSNTNLTNTSRLTLEGHYIV